MENEILNRIDELSSKLNVASDKLYSVLIKQSEVELYSIIVQYGIIIGWIGLTIYLTNKFKGCFDNEEIIKSIALIVMYTMSFIFIIIGFDNIDTIFTLLFNPEFWALKTIRG
jgi:hypothetical protein